MVRIVSSSPEDTRALAARLAALAEPGDLVVLSGELGAGKTCFVQGFARALGVTDTVTSPTFTLAREYRGRLTVHHLDVYRLSQLDEVIDLALPELLDAPSVTLIEWGDAIVPALPADFLEVRLAYGEGDDERVVEVDTVGLRWSARAAAVAAAVGGEGTC